MFCLFSTFRCSYLKLFRSYKKMFTSMVSESWQQYFIWDQISRQTNIVTCIIKLSKACCFTTFIQIGISQSQIQQSCPFGILFVSNRKTTCILNRKKPIRLEEIFYTFEKVCRLEYIRLPCIVTASLSLVKTKIITKDL